MAGVVHISEEEAAKDFLALFDQVRSGTRVLVESPGRRGVMLVPDEPAPEVDSPMALSGRTTGRTAAEILDRLAKWESMHGVLDLDDGFASDVEAAHERLNQPMDSSKWA